MNYYTILRRLKNGVFALFILASLFLISCSHKVEIDSIDYGTARIAKFPKWECHQIFSRQRDQVGSDSFLEVSAFPFKEYPGISLPWMAGNWRKFDTFQIVARTRGRKALPFTLIIWDGAGEFVGENRFEKHFVLDTVWTSCALPLSGGIMAKNNRKIDICKIEQVVFFTGHGQGITVFDVRRIALK
jgi:hypothetical protein